MAEMNEVLEWREKTTRLKNGLRQFLAAKKVSLDDIAEFVKEAAGSVLRIERFVSPFKNTELAVDFEELYRYIQISMNYEGALVLIPIQSGLLQAGALTIDEFIEYLHECVMIVKNIEDNTKEFPGVTNAGEGNEIEDAFNDLLDQVEELAENENYLEAIKKVDEAFQIAQKEPLLFYDKVTMINNRAFYNCQLGNFEEALTDANEAIMEDPDDALPYYTKSEILVAMNKFEQALDSISRSIEIEDSEDKREYRKMILGRL